MNNLLFSAIAIALIYYCFFYLPSQKSNANPPFKHRETQTDELELKNKQVQTEVDEQIESLSQDLTASKKSNQKLLESVNFFSKNKALIKDALEFHLNYASSFLSEHANPELLDTKAEIKDLEKGEKELAEAIKNLSEELESANSEERKQELEKQITQDKKEKFSLESRIANLKNWLDPSHPNIQAFARQKVKNERIVEQCKELLEKFKEME